MPPTFLLTRAPGFLLVLMLGLGLAGTHPSLAQESEPAASAPEAPAPEAPTAEDLARPMGPADAFNRGTPRGSMYGFVVAARRGDWERAAEFLDLRRLSPEQRKRGPELARQLKEVLDRKLWIDFATLSDRSEGFQDDGLAAWQDLLGDIETRDGIVTLLLQRVPRQGDEVRIWKVASTTVERTPSLYQEFGPIWLESKLPPVFFQVRILDLALWQWCGLVLLGLGGWLVSILLAKPVTRLAGAVVTRRRHSPDERIVELLRKPVQLVLGVLVFSLGRRHLALGIPVQDFLRLTERLLLVVSVALIVFHLIDIAALELRARAERDGNKGMLPVLGPLRLFSKIVIVAIGVLGILGTLGVNITAAVAGLGVGGIAVAFAAQKTLENLFGGFSLFADRPVRVGDFFRYGDNVGTVEEIGLRSTRVRTLDRTVVSIPNGEFSNLALENFAVRDRMRLWTLIGVRYETTPEQLRFLLARLREILLAHPRVTDDPARVRFVGFGAYSLDLEVFAYVDTEDWNEFLAIREDIFLRFMDAVNQAGTGFAFPSNTTYLRPDEGLDPERSRGAEDRVAEWREQGALPFPRFSEETRERLENTLPWPPPGSPDARPAPGEEGP